jgi:hypothetical protein
MLRSQCQLITYPNSLGGSLRDVSEVLKRHFPRAFGGVHLLPFFPSSADRGFAPLTYREVDPAFGTWEDVERTKENLYRHGTNVKRIYNTAQHGNLDVYQVNCTYYCALGDDDRAYLLARAIQLFAPGIHQIYYVGLLAGSNDLELVEATKAGRNINRHDYTRREIEEAVKRPVVQELLRLMAFRN